jgi:hypothetical protein
MKNVIKLLGTIILAAIIAFTMTSCGDGPGGSGAGAGSAFTTYDEAGNKYTLAFSGSGRSARAAGNDNSQGNDNDQGKKGDKYTITVTGPGGNTIGTNEGNIDNVEGDGIYTLQDGRNSFTVETTKGRRILRFPRVIPLGNGKHHEVNGHLSNNGQKVEIREVTVPGGSLADKLAWIKANVQSNTRYTVTVDRNETLNGVILTYWGESTGAINDLEYPGMGNVIILLKGSYTISRSSVGSLFLVRSGVTLELENVTINGIGYTGYFYPVNVYCGALTMQGNSKITGFDYVSYGNLAVSVESGAFTMKDNAEMYGNNQAVYIGLGTFIMQGNAKIHDNTCSNDPAAYVLGNLTMKDNAEIYNNTSTHHTGGVYVGGNFTMQDNTKIYNNKGTYSGGVMVSGGTFTMNGGEIYGNTASGNNNYVGGGGGVFLDGRFRITNGTIYGSNEANSALRNTTAKGGAALVYGSLTINPGYSGFLQYGIGSKWTDLPLTEGTTNTSTINYFYYTDNTIKVINGVLQ